MLEIVQLPVLQDNYIYILHDAKSGETAVVDPAHEKPVIEFLNQKGWHLTYILNTHHHWDHTGGNLKLKDHYKAQIIGCASDQDRIPGIDIAVGEGDNVFIGNHKATVYFTPGHTSGHIVYHFPDSHALFSGDTLFSMGCGRLFEGSAEDMWQSLSKLITLPDSTQIYCAHEYTQSNGAFALSIDPENPDLIKRMQEVQTLRAAGKPTIPALLGTEKQTNPFLRPMDEKLQQNMNKLGAPLPVVFAEIRRRKDNF